MLSVEILCRALVEELFIAQWVAMSEANGKLHEDEAEAQWHDYLRRNLDSSYGRLREAGTGQYIGRRDTKELIGKLRPSKRKAPDLIEKARLCGLELVYSMFYRAMSIAAHGNDLMSATTREKKWSKIEDLVHAFSGLHSAILLITQTFFEHGEVVISTEILRMLRVYEEPT